MNTAVNQVDRRTGRSVVLLSNIPHYHHLAEALDQAGLLSRYLTVWSPLNQTAIPKWVPAGWRRKLEGRRLQGVAPERVEQILLAEALQKLLPALRVVSAEHANFVNNHLFDRLASRFLESCEVFHFVSSVGLYCARKAKRSGARIVCDVRQEHPSFQKRILQEEAVRFRVETEITGSSYNEKVFEEFALSDYLVVPSSHARKSFVEEGFEAERILQIPYGVDLRSFRPVSRMRDGIFRILYVGSVTLRKGLQYLLEACRRLRLANSELVVAGPIDPAFRPILSQYEGIFRYVAPVPKADLYQFYGTGDVFVLPSLADSFSLATLEAMACGLPVVVSENTGAADIVQEGRHGHIVPIRNVDQLCQRLEELAADPERAKALGQAARVRAQEMTWARYGREALQAYRGLLMKSGETQSAAGAASIG